MIQRLHSWAEEHPVAAIGVITAILTSILVVLPWSEISIYSILSAAPVSYLVAILLYLAIYPSYPNSRYKNDHYEPN